RTRGRWSLCAAFLDRAKSPTDSVQKASTYRPYEPPLATPTREEHKEAYPLHPEGGNEADPVVPPRVLPHHLEEVPDAVVHALRATFMGIRRAVMDKRSRDDEGAEPSSPHSEREIDILAISEQTRIKCPHRADHSRINQHGAPGRVVDVCRRAVRCDPRAHTARHNQHGARGRLVDLCGRAVRCDPLAPAGVARPTAPR